MSHITHLRSIGLTTNDVARLARFYEDVWGLERVADDPADGLLLRGRSSEHHLLSLQAGQERSMAKLCLGAADEGAVDAVADAVQAAGAEIIAGPGPRQAHGGGYAVTFRDPEGRVVEVSAGVAEHAPLDSGPGPQRLSHAVLNTASMDGSVAFYTDVLGFKVSDAYEDDLMVFLRCNELHHCIVFADNPWPTINHIAFEVEDVDAVMHALGRLRRAGVEPVWGPGRHGPGGNVFCYFQDPARNVIEYTAELLALSDDWTPSVWERTPENADVWGTSGGITQEVIQAMRNPPADQA